MVWYLLIFLPDLFVVVNVFCCFDQPYACYTQEGYCNI